MLVCAGCLSPSVSPTHSTYFAVRSPSLQVCGLEEGECETTPAAPWSSAHSQQKLFFMHCLGKAEEDSEGTMNFETLAISLISCVSVLTHKMGGVKGLPLLHHWKMLSSLPGTQQMPSKGFAPIICPGSSSKWNLHGRLPSTPTEESLLHKFPGDRCKAAQVLGIFLRRLQGSKEIPRDRPNNQHPYSGHFMACLRLRSQCCHSLIPWTLSPVTLPTACPGSATVRTISKR